MKRLYQLVILILVFVSVGPIALAGQNPHIVLETNFGDIVIELYPDAAPVTVDNFLSYTNSGFYDGLLFHRVIKDFMIQGGGYYLENIDGTNYITKKQPNAPIVNESDNGLSNVCGTIAMARTTEPDSATSEFFINHIDNLFLDRANAQDGVGYCVFGSVVDGMEVVNDIALTPVYYVSSEFQNFPYDPTVDIIRVYALPCDVSYCGDMAGDSRIGFEDFAVFASRWLDNLCGSDNDFCGGSDLNYNGMVDIIDLELFIEHWTRTAGYEPEFSDLVVDNSINLDDLTVLMAYWLDSGCDEANQYCGGADIDHSGTVNLIDYSLLSNNWLGSY